MIKLIKKYIDKLKNKKPKDVNIYQYAFTDTNGKKWYRLKNLADYNIVRLAKQKEFFTFLSAAISAHELDKILDEMEKAIHKGLSNPREAAKVAVLVSQLRDRRKYCVHTELFLNIIACDLLREDEDLISKKRGNIIPFDEAIHEDKVKYLKEVAIRNPDFFLSLNEYKQLAALLQISEMPFNELQKNFHKYQKILEESLKIYS